MRQYVWLFGLLSVWLLSCEEPSSVSENEVNDIVIGDSVSKTQAPPGYFYYSLPPVPEFLDSYDDVLSWDSLLFESGEAYSEEFDAIWMKPVFEERHYDLTKSRIVYHGIVDNIFVDTNIFHLYRPGFVPNTCVPKEYDICRVIRLNIDSVPEYLDYNKFYEVFITGVLEINEENYKDVNYILNDVEFLWTNEIKFDTSIQYFKDGYFDNYVLKK